MPEKQLHSLFAVSKCQPIKVSSHKLWYPFVCSSSSSVGVCEFLKYMISTGGFVFGKGEKHRSPYFNFKALVVDHGPNAFHRILAVEGYIWHLQFVFLFQFVFQVNFIIMWKYVVFAYVLLLIDVPVFWSGWLCPQLGCVLDSSLDM